MKRGLLALLAWLLMAGSALADEAALAKLRAQPGVTLAEALAAGETP